MEWQFLRQVGAGVAAAEREELMRAVYCAEVSELNEHLARMQDIAERARSFQTKQAFDPKAFSKTVVQDLAALAEAVTELIKREEM